VRDRKISDGFLVGLAVFALTLTMFMASAGIAAAQTETVIHAFQSSSNLDGSSPVSSLIADGQGALYGVTRFGGKYGFGCVYKLTPHSGIWKESILYSFSGGADGANPFFGTLLLKNGALYGTASHGGSSNDGVVYKLTPGKPWVETVLHTFTGGADGFWPTGGLTPGPGGVLYGTTSVGGASNFGTVYRLSPQSGGGWTESVIYTFTGGNDGSYPYYGVALDSHGALYGTTVGGGGSGNVFKLIPHSGAAWTETTLYFFNGAIGGLPNSPLIFDGTGSLYGATAAYSGLNGYIFQLSPPATQGGVWTETTIHDFAGSPNDGTGPTGVIFDSTGALWGTADAGGSVNVSAGGNGVVFKLSPPSNQGGAWTESVLYNFQGGADGQYPIAPLVQAGSTFYGATNAGGTPNVGTVFSFTP
jgi:uncharacterized repeat protein (TIGR03803 family)